MATDILNVGLIFIISVVVLVASVGLGELLIFVLDLIPTQPEPVHFFFFDVDEDEDQQTFELNSKDLLQSPHRKKVSRRSL